MLPRQTALELYRGSSLRARVYGGGRNAVNSAQRHAVHGVARKEIAYYRTKLNPYGLPLDNRADYTKLDWELWTATLAERREDFEVLVNPVFRFLNESPSRVPMTDWYMTTEGKMRGFQARSVVGGVYIKMLADPDLWKKWANHKAE